MAKLKPDLIGESDLIDFLDNDSDFSFEILVLNALLNKGFDCEHGGTYDDPTTDKPREFDIRATRNFGKRFLRLAIECKNLHPNFPLLISCLPRRDEEAFHEIIYSVNPKKYPIEHISGPYSLAMLPQSKSVRLTGEYSLYKPSEPVGKSCEQVGRASNGDITTSDSDIYTKWAQALSSAHDLTYLACSDGRDRTGDVALSLVFPIVVVPNGCLWVTHFNSNGKRTTDPKVGKRCSYFIGRSYYHLSPSGGDELTLSHLEFVTMDGLEEFLDSLCGTEAALEHTFPAQHVIENLQNAT